ncbi:MAG: N-acetyltransferase [Ruminococcus sp.]|nr:N-acetyltransferase [Ruminococcus sp.]
MNKSDVYKKLPVFENENYLLRFVEETDVSDLLEVYSDKNALPFFNSDNCNGDNFYYPTEEKMLEAVKFWLFSYRERYFVRFTVIDKSLNKAVGTVELFRRDSNDKFDGDGVLRLDVKSNYEKENVLFDILSVIVAPAFEMFDCTEIITKVPVYAVERIKAVQKFGFSKSEYFMIGTHDGYAYKDYWTVHIKRVNGEI